MQTRIDARIHICYRNEHRRSSHEHRRLPNNAPQCGSRIQIVLSAPRGHWARFRVVESGRFATLTHFALKQHTIHRDPILNKNGISKQTPIMFTDSALAPNPHTQWRWRVLGWWVLYPSSRDLLKSLCDYTGVWKWDLTMSGELLNSNRSE